MTDPKTLFLELESVAREIQSMTPTLVERQAYQTTQLANLKAKVPELDRFRPEYWVIKSRIDSLRKLQAILPQSLVLPESMGVLALTRYVFELTVWLKIIDKDERYGLTYYRQLIENQRQHYATMHAQYLREVAFLEGVDLAEKQRIDQDIASLAAMPEGPARSAAASRLGGAAMADIDSIAARSFSIYARDAQTNGYGFQAYLVRTKAIPQVDDLLAQVDAEEKLFRSSVPAQLLAFTEKDRKWSRKAVLAGMESDYEYIYSFTSRLLHAEPASISINQQMLEPNEVLIFLRYVKVCIADILEICGRGRVAVDDSN